MEEETKRVKRHSIMIFALATVVAVNFVITGFLYTAYERTQVELQTTSTTLQDLLNRVQATSKYVAIGNITLTFTPYMPVQTVSGTMITYLLGFVSISNLTNIIARPLTLIVQFVPEVTYPEYGTVTYDYTDVQVLEIPPELDVVLMPWGAFPVTLQGFKSEDEIIWRMDVIATCEWMGNPVTSVMITVEYKLVVA